MSRLFLEHLASSDPQAEHVVIEDQAGFHLNPELHPMPARIHVLPLPPYSPELNPVEAIGDLVGPDRQYSVGNALEAMEDNRRGTPTALGSAERASDSGLPPLARRTRKRYRAPALLQLRS